MSDIVELDEHRPHISGPVVCTRCRNKWEAVRPIGADLLECPACGASRGASLDTMLHKPHIILGEECCGQRDSDGVCAVPACLYGDALTLVQCIRDAYHLEYTALRAENERLRETLIDVAASLAATISLLERGGKKAAPSNAMFEVMLDDCRKSLERARAALEENEG